MGRFRMTTLFSLAIALFLASTAFATEKKPILFGSEFTFSNLKVLLELNKKFKRLSGERQRAFDAYAFYAEAYCLRTDCETTISRMKAGVTDATIAFPDGLEIHAEYDQNVIEFRLTPLSLADIQKKEKLFQEVIFRGMQAAGLRPMGLFGSGHVNIDKSTAFGGDVHAYRDFFVDFHNHPGLADGVLEKDPYNARSVSLLPEDRRRNFEEIVRDVDAGRIKTIEDFEKALKQKVYVDPRATRQTGMDLGKGHALYFSEKKLEIRAVRAQQSAKKFTALVELFETRIEYLRKLRAAGTPVKWIRDVGANTALQSFSQFYYYVTDAGLPWKKYKSALLPSKYLIYPGPTSREFAFAERLACLYWFKNKRTKIFVDIGSSWSGY